MFGLVCFMGPRIKKITVDLENPYLKDMDVVLYTKDGEKLIKMPAQKTGHYVVPEGVEEIENYAFEFSQLDEVILPDSLQKIGSSGFSNSSLKKIAGPKGVSELEDGVFCDCRRRIFTASGVLPGCLPEDVSQSGILEKKFIAAAKLGKRDTVLAYLLSTMPDTPVEKGSVAHRYASKKKIRFELV